MESKEILINLSVIGFSFLIVLGALELALGAGLLAEDQPRFKFCGKYYDKGTFHTEYGWTGFPNNEYIEKRTSEDDWSYFKFNEEGFRDTYKSGEENIFVLGDSFTRGTLVDQNQTFEHLLDRNTPETAFHNYGMSEYGTQQQLLVYRNHSDTDHRAVILAYYFGNDPADNLDRSPQRPVFELRNGEPEQVRKPQKTGKISDIKGMIYHNTFTPMFFVRNIKRAKHMSSSSETNHNFPDLEITESLVEELSQETQQKNAELIVIGIPNRAELSNQTSEREEYWRSQRQMLSGIASNHSNTDYIDLKSVFEKEDELLYGKINGHLDDKGHMTVAEVIYQKLIEKELIKLEDPEFSRSYGQNLTRCP